MVASSPEIVRPVTETTFPDPTVFVANAPMADDVLSVTASPEMTPDNTADEVVSAAVVVLS